MVRNQADRARRCFCERESEPVISRIGYVLHAYVHMHTHACPMPVEEGKKKKKKEKLADSIIVEEVRFPRFCCMYGRIKLVRRSKRREERLVTEARKLNEKSLTVR